MRYLDATLMVLFALASLLVLFRLLGRRSSTLDAADPSPGPRWQQVLILLGLLLLTAFATLRTFQIGPGQLHMSLGLLAVALLLLVGARRNQVQ